MRWNFRQKKLQRKKLREPIYQNPLFTKKTWQTFIIERFSFFGWLTILVSLLIIYLIFYSPLLKITKIEIQGVDHAAAKTIEEKFIKWQLDQRKWLIFKQNNILLFSKKWLRSNLEEKYAPQSLVIDKKFPHSLYVEINEKSPEFIWVTNDQYYYLDQNGQITASISDKNKVENLTLIYDESNETVKPGQAVLTETKVSFIKQLISQMNEITAIEIDSYSLPNSFNTQFNIQTTAGYKIYFDTSKDLDTQVTKLKRVIDEKDIPSQPPAEYIDLRIGDRVYLK